MLTCKNLESPFKTFDLNTKKALSTHSTTAHLKEYLPGRTDFLLLLISKILLHIFKILLAEPDGLCSFSVGRAWLFLTYQTVRIKQLQIYITKS